MQPMTQADFFNHLRTNCIEGIEDPFERIRNNMDGVREDLASAADDLDAFRSRTATSDIEDAAVLMGEAIGYAYGYKVAPGEGHHWKAIRLLALYLGSCVPGMARQAGQLEMLRTYRHRVKYDGADAPAAQTRMYYELVRGIHDAIREQPLRLLSERQNAGRGG